MDSGPHDALTDVPGLRVGHAALGPTCGTTVVLAPPGGAVGGVDVRGSVPGTRETDLLDPGATVGRLHAIVLSGGGAFGLATAGGVVARLEAAGIGFGVPGGVVPIVPGAVLPGGGDRATRPDAALGAAAYDAATDGPVGRGGVGVGAGADGVGTASAVLPSGALVAALVVLDGVGAALDPATGLSGESLDHPAGAPFAPTTTLAVVATDVALDKAGCRRLATMGHDGLTRAVSPAHAGGGEVVFGLSTGARPTPELLDLFALHAAAADVVTRATVRALPA